MHNCELKDTGIASLSVMRKKCHALAFLAVVRLTWKFTHALINEKAIIMRWDFNDKILFFLLHIGEILAENINYYRFYWHARWEKMSRFVIFWRFFLFSTWQKTSIWSESMHKWPILVHLIWLTWNRSVWSYKWGRHFGHSYTRRKLPVLHHEINDVCCTVEEISCRQMGIGV